VDYCQLLEALLRHFIKEMSAPWLPGQSTESPILFRSCPHCGHETPFSDQNDASKIGDSVLCTGLRTLVVDARLASMNDCDKCGGAIHLPPSANQSTESPILFRSCPHCGHETPFSDQKWAFNHYGNSCSPNEDVRTPKNISDRRFEHFFKGVSVLDFGYGYLKSAQNDGPKCFSGFENLRLRSIKFMLTKRRFWKAGQNMRCAFFDDFSIVRGPKLVLTPLKSTSKIRISYFVQPSKIFVW
jgi:DNA-directed RNA polymerase subunit M/transcription elongation factor TFIIS